MVLALIPPSDAQNATVNVPSYWGPTNRFDKPDMSRIGPIRFLMDDETPPLTMLGSDGQPAGFAVDLSRALCTMLKAQCLVQVMRFDTLADTLEKSRADDVIIAPLALDAENRRRFDITNRYLSLPARFIARKGEFSGPLSLADLKTKTIGVVADSAHAAYLKAFFAAIKTETFPTATEARQALKAKTIDLYFGDGIAQMQFLLSPEADHCCAYAGGAYGEAAFFGEGLALMVRKGNEPLRKALDYGLFRLNEDGRYQEIYLKHFPLPPH